MSKFLSQKKKLLEEVYEKASGETTETSFHGIVSYLERTLLDDFRISLSYNTFKTYYKTIIEEDGDYNIKPSILNDLSIYLGFESFKEYCLSWKTIEHTIQQAISKIVINISNKPIFSLPPFLKQNGAGIMEMAFVLLLVTGGVFFSNGKNSNSEVKNPLGIFTSQKQDIDKPYMYWNGERFIATDSGYVGPDKHVIAMDDDRFLKQRKITRRDTMTVDNSMHKVWYDKSNNQVEFFTSPGTHPENGKALKDVTEGILFHHAGQESYADR
ncbi:hypothetical protein [uncultured Chryseobacterium sp.]|uniref:hypothetical protein n=1 Tax=uncultured Chryseobacterium sp. TaxID=259322 RepID=UPI0025DAE898|nr:hypothetical protein [uncultured Chryseobacterium sp.]